MRDSDFVRDVITRRTRDHYVH